MKRLSQIFRPTLVVPKDAKLKPTELTSKSQRLLMESGLVRPTTSGCFALLPLATRSLHKLEAAVAGALEAAGAQRVSLPALSSRALWRRTGRLEAMGRELFALEDRHQRDQKSLWKSTMSLKKRRLKQTHEEVITELLAEAAPISPKQLPITLYQVTNKFRDERRPRHGLLRAREFLMADAYSFHAHERCARATYARVAAALAKLLDGLRVPYYRVEADGGAMGGSESHEYHYAARAGEDALAACAACGRGGAVRAAAAAGAARCERCAGELETFQSIEVAHTFILGSRYSSALGATVAGAAGEAGAAPCVMACYGVGVTRLLAAGLEALSDDARLRWPRGLAPYTALVVSPKEGSAGARAGGADAAEALARRLDALPALRGDVLLDDRANLTVGKRLLDADRMGYPLVAVVGREGLELHAPGTEPRTFRSPEQLVEEVRLRLADDAGSPAEDTSHSCRQI